MSDSRLNDLITAILEGNSEKAVVLTRSLVESGVSAHTIVVAGVEAAMSALDAKCTLEQFNLLEIMLAGRTVTGVMKVLYPDGNLPDGSKGKVVIATLEGDVHDLGKNILKMVLEGKGYGVIDCGKDCPVERLIDTVAAEQPLAVGISGLITPVIPSIKQLKGLLDRRGLGHIKVLAGGAALKQSSTDGLNVDFVAESAFDCLKYLDSIAGADNE